MLQQKRPMNIDDLWAMERINKISITPDGNKVFFTSFPFTAWRLNKGNGNISMINSTDQALKG
ncbi:MAG: hypothetical protein IPJ75_09620 [Ignavibacteriales bacterium]|nr:hypothetical protein [Ignavibacteriales bacterium]